MSIDERKIARQLQAADERSRRERREKLAGKAIGMQELRLKHKERARPSRSDVERAIGYAVCANLASRPEGHAVRTILETSIVDLLEKAGFNRSQAGDVLLHMIETATAGQERWLIRRETDRKLARLLAD
ncbi:hypothetical protein ACXIUS_28305 [Bosea thiooxidans]